MSEVLEIHGEEAATMPCQSSILGDRDSECPGRSSGPFTSIVVTTGLVLGVLLLIQASSETQEDRSQSTKSSSRTILRCQENPVFKLTWSPDGRKLAVSTFGPVVRIWDQETGQVTRRNGGTDKPRFVEGWTNDGQIIVVGGLDIPVETWDLATLVRDDVPGVVRPLDRSSQVETLARSIQGRTIRLWGSTDGRAGLLPAEGRIANCMALSIDGRLLASGDADGVLRVWETKTSQVRLTINASDRGITSVAFSPDGSKLATTGGGPLKLWDLATGKPIASLDLSCNGAATLAFSPDGDKIAVAAWDGSIQVWNLKTSSEPYIHRGHFGQVLTLAWSPDGKTVASGGYDSTVRLWDAIPPTVDARSDRPE